MSTGEPDETSDAPSSLPPGWQREAEAGVAVGLILILAARWAVSAAADRRTFRNEAQPPIRPSSWTSELIIPAEPRRGHGTSAHQPTRQRWEGQHREGIRRARQHGRRAAAACFLLSHVSLLYPTYDTSLNQRSHYNSNHRCHRHDVTNPAISLPFISQFNQIVTGSR